MQIEYSNQNLISECCGFCGFWGQAEIWSEVSLKKIWCFCPDRPHNFASRVCEESPRTSLPYEKACLLAQKFGVKGHWDFPTRVILQNLTALSALLDKFLAISGCTADQDLIFCLRLVGS